MGRKFVGDRGSANATAGCLGAGHLNANLKRVPVLKYAPRLAHNISRSSALAPGTDFTGAAAMGCALRRTLAPQPDHVVSNDGRLVETALGALQIEAVAHNLASDDVSIFVHEAAEHDLGLRASHYAAIDRFAALP